MRLLPAVALSALLVLALFAGTALTQSGEGDTVQSLKREVWALKHLLLHPELQEKAGMDQKKHRLVLGLKTAPLTPDAAALLNLKPGHGLTVTGVSEGVSEVREGDILLRVRNPFGDWKPATRSTLVYSFLPGDVAVLELRREGQVIQVIPPVACRCGLGASCPFASPLASGEGVKRKPVEPVFPKPDQGLFTAETVMEVWKAAIAGYYQDMLEAADTSTVKDIQARLDDLSVEKGAKDWADLCVRVARQDPKAFQDITKAMTEFTKKQGEEYARKLQEKMEKKAAEDEKEEEDK